MLEEEGDVITTEEKTSKFAVSCPLLSCDIILFGAEYIIYFD